MGARNMPGGRARCAPGLSEANTACELAPYAKNCSLDGLLLSWASSNFTSTAVYHLHLLRLQFALAHAAAPGQAQEVTSPRSTLGSWGPCAACTRAAWAQKFGASPTNHPAGWRCSDRAPGIVSAPRGCRSASCRSPPSTRAAEAPSKRRHSRPIVAWAQRSLHRGGPTPWSQIRRRRER
jgi:hypothetical protein